MPSSLRRFSKKPAFIPKDQWEGAGYYYYRGTGQWTKWSESKDRKRGGKVGRGKWKHTNDKR